MKKLLGITAILGACLSLIAGPAAAKGTGTDHLDPGFGKNGRAIVRPGLGDPAAARWWEVRPHSAPAPGGGTVMAAQSTEGPVVRIVRLDSRGRLVREFGHNGVVGWTPAAGFVLSDMTVDAAGRIVLLGSYRRGSVVARLDPDGAPDPSFGAGGVVEPDLRIPVLPYEHEAPYLRPTSVAVDAAGRIVLAGDVARILSPCLNEQGFVARLLPDGSGLDASFAEGGRLLSGFLSQISIGGIALDPNGELTIWSNPIGCKQPFALTAISRFTEAGQPQTEFGEAGTVWSKTPEPGLGRIADLTVDGLGRGVYVTGDGVVHRLLPDGGPDPSFGNGGGAFRLIARPALGEASAEAIAVARDGSVLVSGTETVPDPANGAPPKIEKRLLVASLTASGKPRPGFGHRGLLRLSSAKGVGTTGREVRAIGTRYALVTGATGKLAKTAAVGIGLFRFQLTGAR